MHISICGVSFVQEDYPSRLIVNIGSISFGLCHGHQAFPCGEEGVLSALRRYVQSEAELAFGILVGCFKQLYQIFE